MRYVSGPTGDHRGLLAAKISVCGGRAPAGRVPPPGLRVAEDWELTTRRWPHAASGPEKAVGFRCVSAENSRMANLYKTVSAICSIPAKASRRVTTPRKRPEHRDKLYANL